MAGIDSDGIVLIEKSLPSKIDQTLFSLWLLENVGKVWNIIRFILSLQPPCKRPAYPQAGVEYSTTTPQINDEKSVNKAATGQATNSIFSFFGKKSLICLERAN